MQILLFEITRESCYLKRFKRYVSIPVVLDHGRKSPSDLKLVAVMHWNHWRVVCLVEDFVGTYYRSCLLFVIIIVCYKGCLL